MCNFCLQDFLFSETVSFTRDGLLQKTPAHRYSEFKFRTYAPYAFRFFRHLFEIETELFLASLCSEPMVELANPGVSGSIFYVTRYILMLSWLFYSSWNFFPLDFLRMFMPTELLGIDQISLAEFSDLLQALLELFLWLVGSNCWPSLTLPLSLFFCACFINSFQRDT